MHHSSWISGDGDSAAVVEADAGRDDGERRTEKQWRTNSTNANLTTLKTVYQGVATDPDESYHFETGLWDNPQYEFRTESAREVCRRYGLKSISLSIRSTNESELP